VPSEPDRGVSFLETTVQATRTVGSRKELAAYRQWAKGRALMSSAYVLGEFKSTFVRDAVRFHTLLLDSEDASDALQRLSQKTFRPRVMARSIKLFAVLAQDNDIDRQVLQARLEMLIEWQLESRFLEGLDGGLIDATGCRKAHATASRNAGAYSLEGLACNQASPPNCRIGAFWEERLPLLQRVRDEMQNGEDPEFAGKVRAEAAGVLGFGPPHGHTCQVLSDLVIALECPSPSSAVVTV
jgi:hypothetical protein